MGENKQKPLKIFFTRVLESVDHYKNGEMPFNIIVTCKMMSNITAPQVGVSYNDVSYNGLKFFLYIVQKLYNSMSPYIGLSLYGIAKSWIYLHLFTTYPHRNFEYRTKCPVSKPKITNFNKSC